MKENTHTLTLTGAVDGWIRVEEPDGTESFVATVKIAGLELSPKWSGVAEVEAQDFAIEGDYEPCLLIESAEWYTPPEERP